MDLKRLFEMAGVDASQGKAKVLLEGPCAKPTDNDIIKFFSYYSDVATMSDDDIGILFNEEYSDCYTEQEINDGVLDGDMARAVQLVHQYRS